MSCQPAGARRQPTMAEEEVDKHVLRKYDIQTKLGKGVSGGGAGSPGTFDPAG